MRLPPLAILPLLLLAAPAAPAQDLDRVLAQADQQAASGDYPAAHDTLLAAVNEESLRTQVLARYPEITRRLLDWAFEARLPDPQAADLFRGEVKGWRARQRALKIRWNWKALDDEARRNDFFQVKDDWYFSVPLEGKSYKIALEGEWISTDPISLVVGYDAKEHSGLRITPGFRRQKVKPVLTMPRRVERFGKPRETLVRSTEKLDEPAGTWHYSVEVKRGTITLKRGSHKLGSWKTAYPDLLGGYIGFQAAGLETISLEAHLDQDAWGKRRLDLIEVLRQRFRESEYDPVSEMPRWFRELLDRAEASVPRRAPEGIPEAARKRWPQIFDCNTDYDPAEWCREVDLKAPQAEYAIALRHEALGEWRDCAAHARAAKKGKMDFPPLDGVLARALQRLGKGEDAVALLEPELEKYPNDIGWDLAMIRGRISGPRAAFQTLDQALAAGGIAQRIARTRAALKAALAGPAGSDSGHWQGGGVEVLSDGSGADARRVGERAAATVRGLHALFPELEAPPEALLVLHFRSGTARKVFARRAGLTASSSGYLPDLHLILATADSETPGGGDGSLQRAIFDELLGRRVDLASAPHWLVTGMEGLCEAATVDDQGFHVTMNASLVQRSTENEAGLFFRPSQLVNLPRADWNENHYWAEAESYLLVHFLIAQDHGTYAGALKRYLGVIASGGAPNAAWHTAFGHLDLQTWYDDYAAFRKELIDQL